MKKLLIIPILLLSILCNAQFTKGGGMFLKTGSSFMTGPSEPEAPPEPENMISNGDFSNGTTGWTLNDTWNVTDGALVFAGTPGGGIYVYQTAANLIETFEADTDYEIYIDVANASQPGGAQNLEFSIQIAGYVTGCTYETLVNGENHFEFTTGGTVTSGTLFLMEFKITTGSIDNIRVYKK